MRRQVVYYRQKAGSAVALKLSRNLRKAEATLSSEPGIGSPRIGEELGIPELRAWLIAEFPLSFWYFEREDHVDIVRLVGHRQDHENVDLPE